jgi:mannose-6-phosphate isomerase
MSNIFKAIEKELLEKGFRFERTDFARPWGGFFVIEEGQSSQFLDTYYPEEDKAVLTKGGRISPKILIVLPEKRLSWQYHHRRSEVWKVIRGKVGVVRSDTDEENDMEQHAVNDKIVLAKGERHRLVGLDEVGIIAEIWQHSEPGHPSDEDDIVRLQDDFGR